MGLQKGPPTVPLNRRLWAESRKHRRTRWSRRQLDAELPTPFNLPPCHAAKYTSRVQHDSPRNSVKRPFRVFISSTTSELGELRAVAAEVLQRKGLEVVHEQDFATLDYEEITRHLWSLIQISDAVVFLIGHRYGREPPDAPPDAPRRSYTQMEWDMAARLSKQRYVFLSKVRPDLGNPGQTAEPKELRERQQQFREAVAGSSIGRLHHSFESMEDLMRILEEIDFPTHAPRHPRKPILLPFGSLDSLFKGREDELSKLEGQLLKDAFPQLPAKPQVLTALGGIGKTRLAVEYGFRFRASYQAILFSSAETPDILNSQLSRMALPPALGLCPDTEHDESRLRQATLRWLETERDWLLILDNADTPEAVASVTALLPRLASGHVLITSRWSDWPPTVDQHEISTLTEGPAVDYLLEKCSTRRRTPTDTADARDLARDLGFLALALEQAGTFIAKNGLSFGEYRQRWNQEDDRVRGWYDSDLMRYPRSVATTWETSFAELTDESRIVLRVLCWLSVEPIPRSLFRTPQTESILLRRLEASRVNPRRAVEDLAAVCLVQHVGDAIQIHQLVQEVTRHRLPAPPGSKAWLSDALGVVDASAQNNPHDPQTWPIWDLLRPHVRKVTDWAETHEIHEPTGRLLDRLGLLLLRKGAYPESHNCLVRAWVLRKRAQGDMSPEAAVTEGNLGLVAEKLDQLEAAERHLLHAIHVLREQGLGKSQDAANVLSNLASLCIALNRFPEAQAHLDEASRIEDAMLPPISPERAAGLANRGVLLWYLGQFEASEAAHREALRIAGTLYPDGHAEMATMRSNLALVLQDVGRYGEAVELFQKALDADLTTFGDSHPSTNRDRNNLALALRKTGRLDESERLFRTCLAHDVATVGENHSDTADAYQNLGLVLIDQERFEEAIRVLQHALASFERLHGTNHLRIAAVCVNLGAIYKGMGDLKAAFEHTHRALLIQQALLGSDHVEVAWTWNAIGHICQRSDSRDAAQMAYLRAMRIARKALGIQHPQRGTFLTNMARLAWMKGRQARAERLYRGAIVADARSLPSVHPEIAVDYYNLSEFLRLTGRMAEADVHLETAARIARGFLGNNNPATDPRLALILEKASARLGDHGELPAAQP